MEDYLISRRKVNVIFDYEQKLLKKYFYFFKKNSNFYNPNKNLVNPNTRGTIEKCPVI